VRKVRVLTNFSSIPPPVVVEKNGLGYKLEEEVKDEIKMRNPTQKFRPL
jgi:hypothetical protein